jgi:two-component system chemotaxis response regulator CheB
MTSSDASVAVAADIVRVLVCDDSSVVRSVLERLLRADASIRVVAKAVNGLEAIAAVQAGGIDVVILDIEMPVMDGLAALPRLLAADRAVKVLMSSMMTTKGGAIALESLRLGAADFIPKPTAVGNVGTDEEFRTELIAKVRGLGRQCHAYRMRRGLGQQAAASQTAAPAPRLRPAPVQRPTVLGIGSSTGGPAALLTLFQALGNRVAVPILLTQHMPASFTPQLAEHIHRLGGATCAEAVHGETLRPGHVHLAPGNRHLTLVGREGGVTIALTDDPPENFCRPAVDPMLRTLSAAYPGRVLTLMLTGMGQDGLRGAEQVVADGGSVIAQDEASSIVWGMPGAVARAGLCHAVLPLKELTPKLLHFVGRRGV